MKKRRSCPQLDYGEPPPRSPLKCGPISSSWTIGLEPRRRANRVAVTATLRLLGRAAWRGLIDLPEAVTRLRATSFHVSQPLVDALLAGRSEGSA
jgi:hypothetical protein